MSDDEGCGAMSFDGWCCELDAGHAGQHRLLSSDQHCPPWGDVEPRQPSVQETIDSLIGCVLGLSVEDRELLVQVAERLRGPR